MSKERKVGMKGRRIKRADYRQVPPWLNNKRKNREHKKQMANLAENAFLDKINMMVWP